MYGYMTKYVNIELILHLDCEKILFYPTVIEGSRLTEHFDQM